MDRDQFALEVVEVAKRFRQENPHHADHLTSQYLSAVHVAGIFDMYRVSIEYLKSKGARDVLDIGSGVGFAGVIDKTIALTNLDTTDADLFEYCFDHFELKKAFKLFAFKAVRDRMWVDTESTFDGIIMYRFLPFHGMYGKAFNDDDFVRLLTEADRLLNDGGRLLYWGVDQEILNQIKSKYTITWDTFPNSPVAILTKRKLRDIIDVITTANKVL